jgi:hypothetical protein
MRRENDVARLQARIAALEDLAAAAYQLAGTIGAPESWLDALSAAADGRPLPDADSLLPVTAEDCTEFAELRAQVEQVRRIVAVGPAAAELGRLGGQRSSAAKRRSSRANGRKGGRPRKEVA